MKILFYTLAYLVARCSADFVSCGGHIHDDDDYSHGSGRVHPTVHNEVDTKKLVYQKQESPYGDVYDYDTGSIGTEARILNKNTKIEAFEQNGGGGHIGAESSESSYDNSLVRNALEFEKVNIVQPIVQSFEQHIGGQGGGHIGEHTDYENGYGNVPVGLEDEIRSLYQHSHVPSLEQHVNGHGQSAAFDGYENGPFPDSLKAEIDVSQTHPTDQFLEQTVSGHYSRQSEGNGNGALRGGLKAEILSVLHDERKVSSFEQHVGGHSGYTGCDNGLVRDGYEAEIISVLHQKPNVQSSEQHVGGSGIRHNYGHATDGLEDDTLSVLRQQPNVQSLDQHVGGGHTYEHTGYNEGSVRDGLDAEILSALNQKPKVQTFEQHVGCQINNYATDDLEAEILKVIQQQPNVQTIKVIHQRSEANRSKVPHNLHEDTEVKNIRVHEQVLNANGYSDDDGVVHNVQVIHKIGSGQGGKSSGSYDTPVLANQVGYSGVSYGSNAGADRVSNYGVYAGADNKIQTFNSLKVNGAVSMNVGPTTGINWP